MSRISEEKSVLQVWFDPEKGFRFFTPSGEEIIGLTKASVTINDNWDGDPVLPSFMVTGICKVVNEKPKIE